MPFEFSEIVLQAKNVLAQNQSTEIQVGFIDNNGFLFNITNDPALNIEVVQGVATINTIDGGLYILPYSLETLVLKLTYTNIFNYFSLWVIPAANYPQRDDLITTVQRYLYPNCYNSNPTSVAYSKNFATGAIFADTYSFVYQNFLNIYPPFSLDTAWEQELNNNVPWANSSFYNLVIQECNNLSLFNADLFDVTYLITEYIYARLGQQLFVYVQETYSNPQNSWVLGYSQLGRNTILAVPSSNNSVVVHIEVASLTSAFQTELIKFIEKILTPDVTVTLELDTSFSTFGLIIDIDDTYKEDPRLYPPYALKYNLETVFNVDGLISPYNPIFITDYSLSPKYRTVNPSIGHFHISAIATYTYNGVNYPLNVTGSSIFISDNPSVIIMSGDEAYIEGIGVAHVTGSYLDRTAHGTYNVQTTTWVLGFSVLGTDTTLA